MVGEITFTGLLTEALVAQSIARGVAEFTPITMVNGLAAE
jgi:hypothetical protein